jgi:hypothetical protein
MRVPPKSAPAVALLLIVLASTSCHRHRPRPGEAPAEVCTVAHNGQTASTSGYLVQPFFSVECRERCYLWVSPKKGQPDGVYARFTAGTGRNQASWR